jgi:hypothetical protein
MLIYYLLNNNHDHVRLGELKSNHDALQSTSC